MFHERLKKGEQFKLLESSNPISSDETRLHYGQKNVFFLFKIT
jgi:hypothetical protein